MPDLFFLTRNPCCTIACIDWRWPLAESSWQVRTRDLSIYEQSPHKLDLFLLDLVTIVGINFQPTASEENQAH